MSSETSKLPEPVDITDEELAEGIQLAHARLEGLARVAKRKNIEMEPTKDEFILRRLLWSMHGHTGQYGDDGELQCGECQREYGFYDWRRTPAAEIEEKIMIANAGKIIDKIIEKESKEE